MELQEKHRITLLDAKSNVVSKVQTLLKKMEYGEDVSCCTKRLYAAILLINRLDCYCFPTEEIECFNCIEDSDLNKMYEVLADLLK